MLVCMNYGNLLLQQSVVSVRIKLVINRKLGTELAFSKCWLSLECFFGNAISTPISVKLLWFNFSTFEGSTISKWYIHSISASIEFWFVFTDGGAKVARESLISQSESKSNLFYVELPEGKILLHNIDSNEKFPAQFGREVYGPHQYLFSLVGQTSWDQKESSETAIN